MSAWIDRIAALLGTPIGIIFDVSVGVFVLVLSYLLIGKAERSKRFQQRVTELYTFVDLYHTFVQGVLDKLQTRYGTGQWSARLAIDAWFLALTYPILFYGVQCLFAPLQLVPIAGNNVFQNWFRLPVLVAYVCLFFYYNFFNKNTQQVLDHVLAEKPNVKSICAWILWFFIVAGLAIGVVLLTDWLFADNEFWLAFALTILVVLSLVLTFFVRKHSAILRNSNDSSVLIAAVIGLTVAVIGAGAVVAAVAVIGTVAFAVAVAVIGAVAVAFAVLGAFDNPLFIFFALLPSVNAVFDYISLQITRYYLQQGLKKKQSLRYALYDFGLAYLLFLALGFTLIPLVHWTGAVDLDTLFNDINNGQGWQYLWLFITVFSTLLPTALHAVIAVFAFILAKLKQGITIGNRSIKIHDDPTAVLEGKVRVALIFAVSVFLVLWAFYIPITYHGLVINFFLRAFTWWYGVIA